jgi:ABC-type transport system involved in cytochrome c biogenesis permease subunit
MFGQRKSYWMDLGEVSSSVGNHSIIEPMFAQWIQSALFKKKNGYNLLTEKLYMSLKCFYLQLRVQRSMTAEAYGFPLG